MLCTIVSDASFCNETQIGGWAVWIVCNNVRHKEYDAFKEKCETNIEAEIKAAINGLHLASQRFEEATRYHFVVDCKAVIQIIEDQKGKWWSIMQKIAGDADITVKHVRGHKQDGSKRSWVNGWCDRHARKAMRKARDS